MCKQHGQKVGRRKEYIAQAKEQTPNEQAEGTNQKELQVGV